MHLKKNAAGRFLLHLHKSGKVLVLRKNGERERANSSREDWEKKGWRKEINDSVQGRKKKNQKRPRVDVVFVGGPHAYRRDLFCAKIRSLIFCQ